MDIIGFLKDFLSVIATLISLGVMFYVWLTKGSADNAEKLLKVEDNLQKQIHELDDKQEVHAKEIAEIQGEIKHMPDKEAVHELKLAISELNGKVGRLDESMISTGRTVRRVEDFLMKNGEK